MLKFKNHFTLFLFTPAAPCPSSLPLNGFLPSLSGSLHMKENLQSIFVFLSPVVTYCHPYI